MIKPMFNLIPRFNLDYAFSDFLYGIKSIFSGNNDINFNKLSDIFEISSIFFTNSGRTSLYVILKALNLPKRSKIGVPLFSCTSVFDAIIEAGHIPVFIDMDINNYTMEPRDLERKIEDLKAIVVIHTFGRPADMDKIKKIANNVPIIEDCAHALLSRYKGKLVGTIATAGFFSFRSGKYISAGEGGMIITTNPNLTLKIEQEIKKLAQPTTANEIKHTLTTYARSALYHKPWFGLISLPLGSKIENKVDLMNKYTLKTTRIRKSDLYILTKKIHNFKVNVEKQIKNSQYLAQQLKNCDADLPTEMQDTYCNYYLFPIQLKNQKQRDKTREYLMKKGIDTAKLFSKTPEIAKQHYEYKGDCPNTEQVAERILTVPNYYTLEKKELKKISETIKSCISMY